MQINYARRCADIEVLGENETISEEVKQERFKKHQEFLDWQTYIKNLKELQKLKELRDQQQDLISDMSLGKIQPRFNNGQLKPENPFAGES